MSESPFHRFGIWFEEAKRAELNDPNAMTLATVGDNGRPAARIVLLKEWNEHEFVFYSNLGSSKAKHMAGNPYVALLFHWKSLQRQIRIEGKVSPVPAAQADAYFATRPRTSQLGAWASSQSSPLASREAFEAGLREVEARFAGQDVPRPPFWSGWRLSPDYFEFWQAADFRLHDRQTYTLSPQGWETGLLYP